MAAHRAGRAARRVQKNGIILARRFPFHHIGRDPFGVELRTFQIGHQPVHAPRTIVQRGDRKSRRRKLHGLATRCRA